MRAHRLTVELEALARQSDGKGAAQKFAALEKEAEKVNAAVDAMLLTADADL